VIRVGLPGGAAVRWVVFGHPWIAEALMRTARMRALRGWSPVARRELLIPMMRIPRTSLACE
jgi:hypothetical protein